MDEAEQEGNLERWAQEDAPTAVIPLGQEPSPGSIDSRQHWPELDTTMLQLCNGMKVRPWPPRRSLAQCRHAQQPHKESARC